MHEDHWLIGRQPIVDRAGSLWGYELLFRAARTGPSGVSDPSFATANVILGILSGFGMEELLGGHRGFVNVARDLLFSDSLEILPRQRMVLEVLEDVEPSHAVLQRCKLLRAAGFSLALDDHLYDPEYEQLYRVVDHVKIDLVAATPEEVERSVERLRAFPVSLLAEKVETPEQFRRCLDLGFEHFQGYHFARPAVLERRRIGEAGATLLKLLQLLGQDADIRDLELTFRESPGLTYKLLVLVNSVAFGTRQKIGSVRQAIAMLGRSQMRRWLQLALFASDDRRGLDDPLVDMAAVRATFMEHLAPLHPGLAGTSEAGEQAFMIGILSLLDRIYALSMAELVASLRLTDAAAQALERHAGPLGQLLGVAEELENLEVEAAGSRLLAAGISPEQAFAALRNAYAWKSAFR
ncbi:MAG TPA: EAL domain-containing protein [Anaeromyxobacter sp.]|nr:EAL domain-containing protein [Anaeromyxobacter sp.]